jgi:hypothetical protein
LSKTSNVPEYLYVFCLDNKKFCPVAALQALKKAQLKCNLFEKNKQIFRFENGKNLTKSFLNKWFRKNNLKISAHSFRNAIPTFLAKHPNLFADPHVQAWGCWRSNSFTNYQRSEKSQRKWMFKKIVNLLFNNAV